MHHSSLLYSITTRTIWRLATRFSSAVDVLIKETGCNKNMFFQITENPHQKWNLIKKEKLNKLFDSVKDKSQTDHLISHYTTDSFLKNYKHFGF